MVTGVGWTPSNELYSVSDDKSIQRWGLDGEPMGADGGSGSTKLLDNLDAFVTDMKWLSSVRGGNVTAEVFVLGCSDGTFRLYNNLGRLDKTEKAHKSARKQSRGAMGRRKQTAGRLQSPLSFSFFPSAPLHSLSHETD